MPIDLLKQWIVEEKQQGAPDPEAAVLSTATTDAIPHGRVVAIREITEQGLLFFTQLATRKVNEMLENPPAAMTFWFELHQREIIIEGVVEALPAIENEQYWEKLPREAKIRFYSYSETSTRPIISKRVLEGRKEKFEVDYAGKLLPMSPCYCGFRLKPTRIFFYAYRTDELSDAFEYQYVNNEWDKQLISP